MPIAALLRFMLVVCGVVVAAQAQADFPTVPKETYEALKIERSASPKELYEALLKRYMDPAQGVGKGKYGRAKFSATSAAHGSL